MKKIIEKLEVAMAYACGVTRESVGEALVEARKQQMLLKKLKDAISLASLETSIDKYNNKLTEISILRMRLE